MSYTRFAWDRKYTRGTSNTYCYYDDRGFIRIWVAGKSEPCDIEPEDFFEIIMSVLKCAIGEKEALKLKDKIAEELEVKLRKRPLSNKELLERMIKRVKNEK